jgi:DNA-binding transcriptional ArsR family regulator
MSSSSVATYHLSKLEDAGLLKREAGGFTVDKYVLQNSIKISRFLVPRYFFYSVFAVAVLIIELTLLRPDNLYREYVFSVVVTGLFVFFLSYEAVKTWKNGNL